MASIGDFTLITKKQFKVGGERLNSKCLNKLLGIRRWILSFWNLHKDFFKIEWSYALFSKEKIQDMEGLKTNVYMF